MSFVADLDLKERVRSAVDIVDVVGGQMELRRQGANFLARCPWHDDRRPSLVVNPARQNWRCWVCNVGGDVFSFVMKRDGVSFPEALKLLAEQAGIPIEQHLSSKPVEPGSVDDKATLMSAMRFAVDQYCSCLETSSLADAARNYVKHRGISPESVTHFRIGYAPESWDWLLDKAQKAGFSGEILHACGLAIPRKSGGGFYDMFRDRLMFPIFDLQGRPISLGGRVLPGGEDKGGKYINGPETRLFSKSRQLYGLNFAREAIVRQARVMVMEGYTDVIAANQAGIEPVVAVLGTALGQKHVDVLKKFTDTVILVLDGDAAGQRRADEVLEIFISSQVDLRVMTLPDGQDPADYIRENGADAFNQLVDQSPDAIEHKLRRLTDGVDLTNDTHRSSKALETMLSLLAKSPASHGDLRLQQTMMRLARTFMVPQQHLESRLADLRKRVPKHRLGREAESSGAARSGAELEGVWFGEDDEQHAGSHLDAGVGRSQATDEIRGLDAELFETLIEAPELASHAVEVLEEHWLSSDSARELLRAYQILEFEGLPFDSQNCMLTLENESLKNQLVRLEERARAKSETVVLSAEERLDSIIRRYREMPLQAELERSLALVDQGSMSEDDALEFISKMIDSQKLKHGFIEFSDGETGA